MDQSTVCRTMVLAVILYIAMATQPAMADKAAASHLGAAKAAAEGGPRRWQVISPNLNMHAAPAVSAAIIETLGPGAILSNLGCKQVDGDFWCTVRTLRGRGRGFVRGESLRPAKGPDGVIPMGPDTSLARAREGRFDGNGQIACAQEQGQSLAQCRFAVARSAGGDATVVVTFANGFKRMLYFRHGEFIRGDTTMSGNGFDTDWRTQNGMHFIRVDDQRYQIPHAAIFSD